MCALGLERTRSRTRPRDDRRDKKRFNDAPLPALLDFVYSEYLEYVENNVLQVTVLCPSMIYCLAVREGIGKLSPLFLTWR